MSSIGANQDIPRADWRALLVATFCALSIVWMTFAALLQIDGLLTYLSWRNVAHDWALLDVLVAAVSAVWVSLIWASARLCRQSVRRDAVSWVCALGPVGFLIAWQLAYDSRRWVEGITGHRLAVGSGARTTLLIIVIAAMFIMGRMVGLSRLLVFLVSTLRSFLPAAAVLFALSIGLLLVFPPPVFLWSKHHADTSLRRPANADSPDVFLISIDALSYEAANACEAGRTLMPNLRAFARNSTCFARAYASSNFTNAATSTMETGTLPWTHRATQIGAPIIEPLRAESIGAILQSAGYATYSISANLLASPLHHGTYSRYDDVRIASSDSLRTNFRDLFTHFPESSLPTFVYSVFGFLGTLDLYLRGKDSPYDPEYVYSLARSDLVNAEHARPIFMWLHTLPPHAPYLPPPTTRNRLLARGHLDSWSDFLPENSYYAPSQQSNVDRHKSRYLECVMWADAEFGRILNDIQTSGRRQNAIVIVTADHGESFTKGYLGHAGEILRDSVIHVPLIIHNSGQNAGVVVPVAVSQADIMPTILDLVGAMSPPGTEGRSLSAAVRGEPLDPVPVFAMSLERSSRFLPVTSGQFAVIEGSEKLLGDIENGRWELYDISVDPTEDHELASLRPHEAKRLEQLLYERLAAVELDRRIHASESRR